RVRKAAPVPALLPYPHVGEQPEEGAAPISSAPFLRAVQAGVASPREPLGQAVHEIGPYLVFGQSAQPCPAQGLDIRRETLIRPVVVAREVGEAEMNHLVRELPVVPQVLLGGRAANADSDRRRPAAECDSPTHTTPPSRAHAHLDQSDGIATEISRNRTRRSIDPAHQRLLGDGRRAGDGYVDRTPTYLKAMGCRCPG